MWTLVVMAVTGKVLFAATAFDLESCRVQYVRYVMAIVTVTTDRGQKIGRAFCRSVPNPNDEVTITFKSE